MSTTLIEPAANPNSAAFFLPRLPDGWEWSSLGEAALINQRSTALRELPDETVVTFVPMAAVDADSGTISTPEERQLGQVRKGFTSFSEGDVLFAKITPCMENGKAAIASKLANGFGFGSTEFHTLRPTEVVTSQWLFYFVRQQSFRDAAEASFTGTAGQLRVSARFLEQHPLPLPPLAEQRRIVEAIETELTRLDAGVASLKAAQAKLRRYRASVLKAACEGRLVGQDPSDEPASALLQRILAERRERWAADLRAKGKDPAKARYEEPAMPDVTGLPELPAGWAIASMDELTVRITSGSRDWSQYYGDGSGTFLMAQNIRPGFLDLSYRQPVNPPPGDRDRVRSQVEPEDLLVTIVGANTGDVCRVPAELPEHFVCQSVALMRPVDKAMGKYLELYLMSPENGRHQYERYMYGQGRPHLSFEQLKMTAIALPPLAEQRRIVAEVERRLSVVTAMEATVAANLKRAERLRQAILKRAFEGKLVPQDPGDEPASELLERLRAARQEVAAAPGSSGRRGRPRKAENAAQKAPNDAPKRRGRPRKETAQPTGRALPASEPVRGAEQLRIDDL